MIFIIQLKGIHILTNFKPIIELGAQQFIIFALHFLMNIHSDEKNKD